MQQIDLGIIIHDIVARFNRRCVSPKPPVFLSFIPALTQTPWRNRSLEAFIRYFLYESLISNDPEAPVEISLRRHANLRDLTAMVDTAPSYWVQLRINGRGLSIIWQTIEDLFTEIGYRCDERIANDSVQQQLGIFTSFDAPRQTMVLTTKAVRGHQRYDLLLPIDDQARAGRCQQEKSIGANM